MGIEITGPLPGLAAQNDVAEWHPQQLRPARKPVSPCFESFIVLSSMQTADSWLGVSYQVQLQFMRCGRKQLGSQRLPACQSQALSLFASVFSAVGLAFLPPPHPRSGYS